MSATMFRAVMWKELRQNLKWAIFIFLVIGGILAYALELLDDLPQREIRDINGLFRLVNSLEAAAALGGALAGVLLGAVQALAESRGDKWGFLVHRPVSRSTLFWGKAAVGTLLYTGSTGIPIAAAVLRIATLEQLPVQFNWRIALPIVVNLLCGLVFYFAAFLTVMRQARWFASRALAVGTAFGCLVLQAATAATFWQAAGICAAGLLVVGTAAWGTFVAGGQYGAQPRTGRIATGLSIGVGMTVIGGIAILIFLSPRVVQGETFIGIHSLTSKGEFVRIRMEGARILEVTDLDGRAVELEGQSSRIWGAGVLSARLWERSQPPLSFQNISWLFTTLRSGSSEEALSWYYDHSRHLIVAYDRKSRTVIAWAGPDGFSFNGTPPRPFHGQLRKAADARVFHLLMFEDAVYRVDVFERQIERIFQPEPAERIRDVAVLRSSVQRTPEAPVEPLEMEAIWTSQRLILQQGDGTRLLEASLDPDTLAYPGLQVHRALLAPGTPTFLWLEANPARMDRVLEFTGAGAAVNSWILPKAWRLEDTGLRVAATSALLPPILQIPGLSGRTQAPSTLSSVLPGPGGLTQWGAMILSSLACAITALLLGRAYAFPLRRLLGWVVVALMFGPLGLLTMLAVIEWPARESCPSCSRKRVVTREHCEHCNAPFAAPPRDGTEVFEAGAASASA